MSGPRWIPTMLLITAFQLISFAQVIFVEDGINYFAATILAIYLLIEWGWSITSSFVLRKSSPAIEFVAFFLTGIGLAVVAGTGTSSLFTQFLAVALGFALYIALLWMLANVDRVEKFHMPMEVIAIGLLAIGLNGNALLESVGQQIEAVRFCLYAVGALKPLAHLFGVLVHHLPQRAIECGVLYAGILCTSRKALVDHCKAVENVR